MEFTDDQLAIGNLGRVPRNDLERAIRQPDPLGPLSCGFAFLSVLVDVAVERIGHEVHPASSMLRFVLRPEPVRAPVQADLDAFDRHASPLRFVHERDAIADSRQPLSLLRLFWVARFGQSVDERFPHLARQIDRGIFAARVAVAFCGVRGRWHLGRIRDPSARFTKFEEALRGPHLMQHALSIALWHRESVREVTLEHTGLAERGKPSVEMLDVLSHVTARCTCLSVARAPAAWIFVLADFARDPQVFNELLAHVVSQFYILDNARGVRARDLLRHLRADRRNEISALVQSERWRRHCAERPQSVERHDMTHEPWHEGQRNAHTVRWTDEHDTIQGFVVHVLFVVAPVPRSSHLGIVNTQSREDVGECENITLAVEVESATDEPIHDPTGCTGYARPVDKRAVAESLALLFRIGVKWKPKASGHLCFQSADVIHRRLVDVPFEAVEFTRRASKLVMQCFARCATIIKRWWGQNCDDAETPRRFIIAALDDGRAVRQNRL